MPEENENVINLDEPSHEIPSEEGSSDASTTIAQAPGGPSSRIIEWIGNSGIVKNEKQATYVVFVVFILVMIVVVLILFVEGGGASKVEAPSGYTIIETPGEPPRLDRPYLRSE